MRHETLVNGYFFALAFKSVNYSRSLCVRLMQILFRREQTILEPKSKVCFLSQPKKKEHFIFRMTKMASASG